MSTVLAKNLRARAAELALTSNEVARRAGLHERRYANYVIGRREPDIGTLVKIAHVLQTSPNDLLGFSGERRSAKGNALRDRMTATLDLLSDGDVEVLVSQAEAMARLRTKR